MSDTERQLAVLKERVGAAVRAGAKAEQQAESARERHAEALAALQEEFSVTPEQVPALLESMEADLAAEIARVTELLEAAGGSTE